MRLLETWHARRCNQTDASRIAGQSVLQKVLHAAWHTAFVPRRDRGMGWQTRINILMAISRERSFESSTRISPALLPAADILLSREKFERNARDRGERTR